MEADVPDVSAIPLLVAASGLLHRGTIGELCQLYLKDVLSDEGVWFLDINEVTPDKSLKRLVGTAGARAPPARHAIPQCFEAQPFVGVRLETS